MHYTLLPNAFYDYEGLCLRAVQPEDIQDIRRWRNAQMEVLRQDSEISEAEQIAYFERVIWPDYASQTPKNILLTLSVENEMIGYGGLVHIDWQVRSAEVSILLRDDLANTAAELDVYWPKYLRAIKQLSADELGLLELTTEIYALRHRHVQKLEEAGFKEVGRKIDHVIVDGKAYDSILQSCALV